MIGRVAIALVLSLAVLGCTRMRVTLGHPVQPEDAAAVVPGLSKAKVLSHLGPPDRVEIEPGGSAFDYLYARTSARYLDLSLFQASVSYDQTLRKVDRLRVSFDRDGIVRHVGIIAPEGE